MQYRKAFKEIKEIAENMNKECFYKTSGNISKFDIVKIKDSKECVIYMSKLLEKKWTKSRRK